MLETYAGRIVATRTNEAVAPGAGYRLDACYVLERDAGARYPARVVRIAGKNAAIPILFAWA